MSQNYETCYSTLSNMKAYRQQCYNFLDYFIHFSLFSACNTAFSLSSLVSIFPLLPISFSLSFFFISPSLHLCFSFSLSFFSCHYLSLFLFLSRRRRFRFEAELANLKLYSPRGSRRSLFIVLHSSRHRSRHRWLVEFGH